MLRYWGATKSTWQWILPHPISKSFLSVGPSYTWIATSLLLSKFVLDNMYYIFEVYLSGHVGSLIILGRQIQINLCLELVEWKDWCLYLCNCAIYHKNRVFLTIDYKKWLQTSKNHFYAQNLVKVLCKRSKSKINARLMQGY